MKRIKRTAAFVCGLLVCGAVMAASLALPRQSATDIPPIAPPFLAEFGEGVESLDSMTIIDANEDGKTWSVMARQARITYNNKLAMDDWMITRGLILEAGKAYEFSITACNSNGTSYVEEFEAKLGTAPTVEAMTLQVLPVSKVNSKNDMVFKAVFHVQQSGTYYLGIHGCSPKNKRTLYLDNIRVSAAMSGDLPSAVTEAVATPDANGRKIAVVSFNAPSLNLIGTTLQCLDKIEVMRGDQLIHTFSTPAPAAPLSLTDTVDKSGTYTYTIIPYTAEGAGTPVSVSAFIGLTKPQPVSNVRIEEGAAPGLVTISWDAPAQDLNGKNLNADALCYRLQDVSGNVAVMVVDSLKPNTYTYQAVTAADRTFKQYQINAITEGGISSAVFSAIVPIGAPETLPWKESFADGSASHLIGSVAVAGQGSWTTFTSVSHPAQDGDNGLMAMAAKSLNDAATLFTGKIDLGTATTPTLSFYTWNFSSSGENINELKVEVVADGTTATLLSNTVANLCDSTDAWNRLEVDLAPYKGKTIQLRFTATAKRYGYTLLDAIRVYDKVPYNLTLAAVEAPQQVKTGETFNVTAILVNNGYETASGHKVHLMLNGETIRTVDGNPIPAEGTDTITFSNRFTPLDVVANTFSVAVDYDKDLIPADNSGLQTVVNHNVTTYPAPTNITGHESRNNTVKLEWSAPATDGVQADPVTETFEQYPSFATSGVGDWLFVDGDKGAIGMPGNTTYPGIQRGDTLAYFVLDSSLEGLNGSFSSHSGNKCLTNMYITSGDKKVDDWLISPELCGKAQTVTFWAKSYSQSYMETFEILYSTAGTDTADFRLLETKERIIYPWTEYSFALPQGARYFAIRCISEDCFFLMLDDFTYIPAGFANLELLGYNIYRDGKLVTPEPVAEPRFTDSEVSLGTHTYHVTAMYRQGESAASAPFSLITTSVGTVADAVLNITANNGNILIDGAEGLPLTIAETGGKVIFSGRGTSAMRIPAPKGLYIVKAGTHTAKVLVK